MTRKTTVCYTAVFEFIEEHLFQLQPHEIITDYEAGLRLAISRCWPEVTLRGCWFHYEKEMSKAQSPDKITEEKSQRKDN